MNDSAIETKLDFSKPINFLLHGFLAGLLDGNMHSGGTEKPTEDDGKAEMIFLKAIN